MRRRYKAEVLAALPGVLCRCKRNRVEWQFVVVKGEGDGEPMTDWCASSVTAWRLAYLRLRLDGVIE